MGEGAVAEVGGIFLEGLGEGRRFFRWGKGWAFWACGIEAGEGAEFGEWEVADKVEEGREAGRSRQHQVDCRFIWRTGALVLGVGGIN